MELAKDELVFLAEVTDGASQFGEIELCDLQLALVGGGIGDIVGA